MSAVDPACDGVVHSTESISTDAKDSHLVLQLPKDIPDVTQHYIDFVRCEQYVTAMKVKECMQQQWSHIIVPGQKLKVKIKGVLTSAVVKKSHYTLQNYPLTPCTFMQQLKSISVFLVPP